MTLVTNEGGAEVERLAYEPFGKRRFAAGTDDPNNTILPYLDRGFTSHEHLDEVALIHMNGRIYDPVLGRFITADPFLQDPGNLQDYNRYSYVNNNPLMYVDPSGYFSLKKVFRAAVAVAAIAFAPQISAWAVSTLGPAGLGLSAAVAKGVVFGGIIGGVIGGDTRSIVSGAIGGGLFGFAGDLAGAAGFGEGTFGRAAFHGFAGGTMSAAQGGDFGQGFLSAGAAQWIGHNLGDWGAIGNGVKQATLGGTFSVIGGGKFANGAITGAYGYLFNHCSHGVCTTKLEQTLYDWWPGYKAGTLIYNQTIGDGSWTAWEVLDAVSVGIGATGAGLNAGLNGGAKSVFYAGYGAADEAAQYGMRILDTPVGKVLNVIDSKGLLPFRNFVWEQASATFAGNATGIAQTVIRYHNPKTIFSRVELPILQRNGVLLQPR